MVGGMSASGTPAAIPRASGESRLPPRTYAAVVDAPLSVDGVLARVLDRRVGGIGLFVGVIRDRDDGADVSSLDYTRHPSAEDALRTCAEQAAAAYDVLTVAVEHRIGHLEVGDLAVV